MLCAVNDAVFFVKAFDRALPGTIGVGMMQRLAGNMMLDTPLPVLPFSPPRGARLPLATIVMEIDLMGKGAEVRVCARARERERMRVCAQVYRERAAAHLSLLLPLASLPPARRRRSTRASSLSTSRALLPTTSLR